MNRWRRYPKYKPSGVEWLGEVPEGWEIKKLHRVILRKIQKNNDSIEREMLSLSAYRGIVLKEYEDDNLIRPKDESLNYIIVKPRQLVVNPMWVINSSIGVSKTTGIVSPAYRVYDVSKEFDGPFFHNLLKTPLYLTQYNRYIRGLTTYDRSVREEDFNEIEVVIPTLLEQTSIAAFIDRKITWIDTLIKRKKQEIAYIQEKQAALISYIVTKGLDSTVRMKDSGIIWIGEVPEHWDVIPLKRRWNVTDCKHVTAEYVEDGIPVVSTTEVKPGKLSLENSRKTTETDYLNSIYGRCPQKGDIIYSRNASLGSAAYVDTNEKFCMGQDVCLITSDECDQLFLMFQLNCPVVMNQIESQMIGLTIKRINIERIKELQIVCPPIQEQQEIAKFLDATEQKNQMFNNLVQRSIDLLKEYRTALISAAVTGKIDVREEVKA